MTDVIIFSVGLVVTIVVGFALSTAIAFNNRALDEKEEAAQAEPREPTAG